MQGKEASENGDARQDELQPSGRSGSLKVTPSLLLFDFFYRCFIMKKVTIRILSPLPSSLFCCEESDDMNVIASSLLVVFQCCCLLLLRCFGAKKSTT
jgi:hypothetical protein